jgi:uncharacterized metal-binding protein YceD (DUF177 family)
MREHRSEKYAAIPWQFAVALEDLPDTGKRFALVADSQIRAAVARLAGLRDLPRLEANLEVGRQGAGLRVTGRVSATVGQNCVATLEPLANEVDEEIDVLFAPRSAAEKAGDEAGAIVERDRDTEPLIDGRIDLGALATEFLILGLDPYPRKPGAVFQPPQDVSPDEGPFTALGALRKDRDGR